MDCPHLAETERCNNRVCPIDCKVSPWDNENKAQCSRSCGGGHMIVTRSVTVMPEHGGKECPSLTQHRSCNEHMCPQDCQVTPWGPYDDDACSEDCNGGIKTRHRTVTHQAFGGGKLCPTLEQTTECNVQNCPVNCEVSPWGTWSLCTVTCGKGARWRERTITRISKWAGHVCPELKDLGECEERSCPIDCKVSEWSLWTACNRSCGGGSKTKTRTMIRSAQFEGAACPALQEMKPCNQEHCPIDCAIGQ